MKVSLDTRPSPIAGQWYDSEPRKLASQVDRYIKSAAVPEIVDEIVAVVAPHAGHIYSGPVAGHAFAVLRDLEPDIVAVVSPMHYHFDEPLITTAHAAYQTPLGELPVDQELLTVLDKELHERLGFHLARVAHDPEHSLEIELPFLQRILTHGFRLLPVMVRDQSERVARGLGEALAAALAGRLAILVASTDLSHFYPQRIANALDQEMLRRMEAFNPQSVLDAEKEGVGFACGKAAVAAVMWAAKALGADRAQVLNYATSGDVTHEYSQVVGYGALVITRTLQEGPKN